MAATHTRGNMCSNTKIIVMTRTTNRIKKEDKVECLRACNPHKGIGKFEIEYLMEYKYEEIAEMETKSNCLMAQNDTNFMKYEGPRIITLFGKKVRVLGIRRLTPTECARLQTIPTWYKWECSDSQAYRMLGNGWTVEVIKHIFNFLPFARERATDSQRR